MSDGFWHEIFELKCVLKNVDVRLNSWVESGVKQLIALITSDNEIVFHYVYGDLPPIIKRIPWFTDGNKFIQAICFDPTATWLLAICLDGSIFIIPALSLVDKKQKIDCKWAVSDLTHFPKHQHTPSSKPSAVLWWQTLDCNQNAMVGYETGEIALISLTDGRCLGTCSVRQSVQSLALCYDNKPDIVSLLINGASGQQWRLLLEYHSLGYLWPQDSANHADENVNSLMNFIKTMGIKKLNNLKKRLRETKDDRILSSDTDSNESFSDLNESNDSVHLGPELLPHLMDTVFSPQFAKNSHVFTAFCKTSGLFMIYADNMESVPLDVFHLPPGHSALLTDFLVYTVNEELTAVTVVNPKSVGSTEPVLAVFNVQKEEKILSMYKLISYSTFPTHKTKVNDKKDKSYSLPKNVDELNIKVPKIDTCILVTNKGIYKLVVSCCPIRRCIQKILEQKCNSIAEICRAFNTNISNVLECAGDLFLSNGDYGNCLFMYRDAGVDPLNRILKIATVADCKTLLRIICIFLNNCSKATIRSKMSVASRIHIGNLAVMAYTELILRYGGSVRVNNSKDFMNFLQYVEFYDQILAVNVACQAGLWNILVLLTKARGLSIEVTTALSQILQTSRAPSPNDSEFIMTLSEPSLLQSLVIHPNHCQIILNYIKNNVNCFQVKALQRFAIQLDPSQPGIAQFVSRLFQTTEYYTSLESTIDSVDFDSPDRSAAVVKEVIESYIYVLVTLVQKNCNTRFDLNLLENIPRPEPKTEEKSIRKFPNLRSLACGYEHAAIIRNHCVYTMGSSSGGCLGLGPLLTQSSPPKLVQSLAELKVRALTVSCGRKHTLVLTDFGVYCWGSNMYGQLGLGPTVQESPNPQLIVALAQRNIIDVICGQYHSMALTASGQVYCWGWGIHGQLGHGTCDNEYYPRLLAFEHPVMQIAAGYAHSLMVTCGGKLYGFGSNAFGQLGTYEFEGNKSNKPVVLSLLLDDDTPFEKIATAYFQNIAVLEDQRVYTWGASPQEIRMLQSKQAQKKQPVDSQTVDSWKAPIHVYSGTNKSPIEQVAVGYRHIVVLQSKRLYFGNYKDSRLKQIKLTLQEASTKRHMEVACGTEYSIALEQGGKVYAFGKLSLTQTVLGSPPEIEANETAVVLFKNTRRVINLPNSMQYGDTLYSEIPGLPSMTISFNTTDYRTTFKHRNPYSIRAVENASFTDNHSCHQPLSRNLSPLDYLYDIPEFAFGPKTLHYVLETYHNLYDTENIIAKCLELGNYQAAAKVSILDGHYSDSLGFQLAAFKLHMDKLDLDFADVNLNNKSSEILNEINERRYSKLNKSESVSEKTDTNSPAHILSSSSSLDSIRQWAEDEHQGGRESPCQLSELGDIRQSMNQYVQSLKNESSPPISSVSKIIDLKNDEGKIVRDSNETDFCFKDEKTKEAVVMAACLVEFYTRKIYASENHILMQNVLTKCIEFWLANGLPVCILENVLLKNMDKYFYPLSVLLFCKNFNNNMGEDIKKDVSKHLSSAGFLKQFSSKFCLQLCSMVLENVNKA